MTPAPRRGGPPREDGPRGAILVLYYSRHAPLRASVADHLYSIRRYSGRPCIYVNLAVRRIPGWVDRLGIDLVVFHTLLLATRWHRSMLRRVLERLEPVRKLDCPKVALPQDEYIHTDALSAFVRDFKVDRVLTCAPESELRKVYGDLVDGPTTFTRVLPGYLEPETVARIEAMATSRPRTIDIGYRAYDPEFSLGRHAQLKSAVARVFAAAGRRAGLTTDISLKAADTLLGDDWYRFLLDCRWVVGVEGGASLLDRDGAFLERSRAFQKAYPAATFEEAEAACFPGADGGLDYVAISPRHLEACVTRTGQILVEGSYNGILEPGVHYLPVRADFSDVDEVLALAADDGVRERLTERAYRDVVAAAEHTYPSFVRTVLESLPDGGTVPATSLRALRVTWDSILDRPSWWVVRAAAQARRWGRAILDRVGLLDLALRVRDRAGRGN